MLLAYLEEFTLDELASYDGRGGHRAYIAYQGKVYDVTESPMWTDGDHLGTHQAGHDLTQELEAAPHSKDNLAAMKLVGILAP